MDGENCSQQYCRVKPSLVKRERVYTCRVKAEADSRETRSATLSFSLFLPPPSSPLPLSLSLSLVKREAIARSILRRKRAVYRRKRGAFPVVGREMRPDVCRTPNQRQFKLLLSRLALRRR